MKIISSILFLGAITNTAYGLSCWNCPFTGDQNPEDKSCLNEPIPKTPEEMKNLPKGLSKIDCGTGDVACAKMAFKMDLLGKNYNFVARQCMPKFSALAGRCMGTEVPGPGGKSIQAEMCVCNSDQCNTASFSTQASILTVLVSIVSLMLQQLI